MDENLIHPNHRPDSVKRVHWLAEKIVSRYYPAILAKRANLDLKTFWDCIRASAGNSFVWETGGPMVFQGTYDPSFTIELQNKDNQLGYQIAKKYKASDDEQVHSYSNCI